MARWTIEIDGGANINNGTIGALLMAMGIN